MNKIIENDVTIVGAGVAGISAANELLKNGYSVTLLEQRNTPGGRINSFLDQKSGDIIDNGQHLVMGVYKEFLSLLSDLGTSHHLKYIDKIDLRLISKKQTYHLFSQSTGKISFALSVLNLQGVSLKDKLSIFYLFSMLEFQKPEEYKQMNCLSYLKKYKQSNFLIKLFWEPLILATLNNKPENAPASLLITVMKKAFLSDNKSSQMILSDVGLSELIEPIVDKVNSNGNYHGSHKLTGIEFENGKVNYITTNNETKFKSKHYILALQANEILKFYPTDNEFKRNLSKFEYSPIVSVYLWFDSGKFDFDFAAFVESETQWLFNRRKFIKNDKPKYSNHITLLISSAYNLIEKSSNEILEIVLNDLFDRFPDYKGIKLEHFRVIKEKFATLKISSEVERIRPTNKTEISNLFIAGDWTDTKLPATIESAALSGKIAAEVIINNG